MGRPPKPQHEKRQLVGVRFDPEDRMRLEEMAARANRSVGAEAERRVIATLGLDEHSLSLVALIATEISAIQKETGAPWHLDQRTWFAVAELMRNLPPIDTRPDIPDDELEEAAAEVRQLSTARTEVINELSTMGLPVPEFANPIGMVDALGDPRQFARQFAQQSTSPTARGRALKLLDDLDRLDGEIEDAGRQAAWASIFHIEQGEEGRNLYRRRLQSEALRKRDAGQRWNPRHLIGDFE